MKFIICVLIAALLSWITAKSFDTPVVYRSYSTKEVTGWEDRDGYHDCSRQACVIPEEYELVWVE